MINRIECHNLSLINLILNKKIESLWDSKYSSGFLSTNIESRWDSKLSSIRNLMFVEIEAIKRFMNLNGIQQIIKY